MPPTPSADSPRSIARNRTEYLTGIAKLESRLGRVEAALKAGRDLLAAAPGNPESYEFFSQLCFQLGRSEEGLDALRRAVRVNPNDTKITLTLAETLAGMYRTDEAIEMYWRAFDKAEDLDDKLGVVSKLTELYLQRNQFDRLLTRLQHQERDARAACRRSRPDAAARRGHLPGEAYASSGDLGAARAEIEPLLAANTRDTKLLHQLSKLAEEEGDFEGAARYQKQLNDLAPTDESTARLAQLYARYGELEEAQAVWSKMAVGQERVGPSHPPGDRQPARPPEGASRSWRSPRRWSARSPTTGRPSIDRARHWRSSKKPEAAERAFRALLALTVADDEKSADHQGPHPRPQAPGRRGPAIVDDPEGERPAGGPARPGLTRSAMACKLDSRSYYSYTGPDLGLGAAGLRPGADGRPGLARQPGAETTARPGPMRSWPAFRKAAEKTPADLRAIWDWFYLCEMRYDNAGAFAAARALSRAAPTDPLALWAYLYALGGRHLGMGMRYYAYARAATPPEGQHAAPRQGRAGACPGLLPRTRGRDAPSWPRPRSSRTSPTS